MTEPIYIVSGFPRSGTSMMMQCLQAGGMSCAYDRTRDAETVPHADGYHPNPHGFYELDNLNNYLDMSVFAGKAIKAIRGYGLNRIAEAGTPLRVVYMRRNPQEIQGSYARLIPGTPHESAFDFLHDYETKVENDLRRLRANGHEATLLNYRTVVASPLESLRSLNWPLDIAAAARVVDPSLYREVRP